ncbi:MAG: hypothetical protein PUA84_08495 [Oscillospiraceae bacterium]|nr:hypothetical protein [Oscillospiraceae bacterium]
MEQITSVLNGYYKNAAVGIDAIESILPKTENEKLSHELHKQMDYYKKQKDLLNEQMLQNNVTPESQGTMAKFYTDMNIAFHSIGGIDTHEIAKLMVQGTNMGIIQMIQTMNRNTEVPENLKKQGKEMIRREEEYIERLKPYL